VDIPAALQGTLLEAKYLRAAQTLLREQAVIRLFEQGDISSGYAAELLGLVKQDFIKLLQKNNVAFFNLTESEWQEELSAVSLARTQLEAERAAQP
jgi:predicted HTH domain antitoxin